jgi:hypothetical protein
VRCVDFISLQFRTSANIGRSSTSPLRILQRFLVEYVYHFVWFCFADFDD